MYVRLLHTIHFPNFRFAFCLHARSHLTKRLSAPLLYSIPSCQLLPTTHLSAFPPYLSQSFQNSIAISYSNFQFLVSNMLSRFYVRAARPGRLFGEPRIKPWSSKRSKSQSAFAQKYINPSHLSLASTVSSKILEQSLSIHIYTYPDFMPNSINMSCQLQVQAAHPGQVFEEARFKAMISQKVREQVQHRYPVLEHCPFSA